MKNLKGNIVFIEDIKQDRNLRFMSSVIVYKINLKINGVKVFWNCPSRLDNKSIFTKTIIKVFFRDCMDRRYKQCLN